MISYTSFKLACKILMRQEFDSEEHILVNLDTDIIIDSERLPGWKAFELIGMAIPKLLLLIVFMANNYEFVIETETLFGVKELK